MKAILEIDSNALEIIKKEGIINSENKITNVWVADELIDALDNAVTLPNNVTNGNIFCLFNKVSKVIELRDCVEVEIEVNPHIIWTSQFDKKWWNTKWEGEQEDGNDN